MNLVTELKLPILVSLQNHDKTTKLQNTPNKSARFRSVYRFSQNAPYPYAYPYPSSLSSRPHVLKRQVWKQNTSLVPFCPGYAHEGCTSTFGVQLSCTMIPQKFGPRICKGMRGHSWRCCVSLLPRTQICRPIPTRKKIIENKVGWGVWALLSSCPLR